MQSKYWSAIEALPTSIKESRKMFVVIAKDVQPVPGGARYTTDPYCVWCDKSANLGLARWPHPFPPTHFCLTPTEFEIKE